MRSYRQKTVFCFLCILFVTLLSGCAKTEQIAYSKTDFYFDTVVTLTVYDSPKNKDKAYALIDEGMAKCREYEALLAPDQEGSDLYRINHAGGEWTTVSEETITILHSALSFCSKSGGRIDITIAPVTGLWDFHAGEGNAAIPPDGRLKKALSHVDYSKISIDGSRVKLEDPEAAIDLGFIAKGYIADQIKKFYLEKGVENAIINLGGNVQTIGSKPDHSGYEVGIQKPFSDMGDFATTVALGDKDSLFAAAATSGTYERCFQIGEKLYHHILDPETGMPVRTDLSSVTILSDNAMEADALSTACLILGSEQAETYLKSLDRISAILIKDDGTLIEVN